MAQVTHASLRALGPLPRIALVAVAAGALLSGALNLRPLFDATSGAIAPAPPSAVDALVGVGDRPMTRLDANIASLQSTLRGGDARAAVPAETMLAQAYLQKVRETGDPSYYPKAETLFQQGLNANPDNVDALVGLGTLALARHQFADALTWGERALAAEPSSVAAYGVVGDAQIELGRYDEAVTTIQAMVDHRPDQRSFARVSYLRELMGDRDGAIAAMEEAVAAGSSYAENIAWVQVQLGNLRFDGGDLAGADHDYAAALAAMPGYASALAGQAKVAAAEGSLDRAADLYGQAVRAIPLPEFLIAYGDVLNALGSTDEAKTQFALVAAIQQLYAASGVDTDLELALFTADYGDPQDLPRAIAQAEKAVATRKSVVAYDALSWVLYRGGDLDGAAAASEQALRLGTRSALMDFHAGMIAAARGERGRAITLLSSALDLNPHFSIRYAPEARQTLEQLTATGQEERS
ncbi:MAG: tetratricopeptide repeat protein [Thermomicrobiales bacterium]